MNGRATLDAGGKIILGLPARIAFYYTIFFIVAMWLYLLLWPNAPLVEADSPGYMEVAQDLKDFHIDQLHGRTPGYPLLLLLTGSTQTPTRTLFVVSLLLHFVSIWFLAAALYLCGLKERALILFGLILLLPLYVERSGYVLTENLCQFTLVLACVGVIFWITSHKIRWILISSIATAYSGLTRPTYQILALAIIAYLLFIPIPSNMNKKQKFKASIILLIGSIVFVGGYALINYLKFNYFGITHMLGFHLTTRTIRYIERLPEEHAVVRDILVRHRDAHLVKPHSSHTGYMAIWSAIPELKKATGLSEIQLSRYLLHINLFLIQKAPLYYLREVFIAFTSYCFPSAGDLANMNLKAIQLIWVIIHFGVLSALVIEIVGLGGVFLYAICRKFLLLRKSFCCSPIEVISLPIFSFLLSGTIVFYTALISCMVEEGEPRVRTPTDALIVFMIWVGIRIWLFLLHHPSVISGVGSPISLASDTCTERGEQL